jgi:arylsulfatase A-like enzyme
VSEPVHVALHGVRVGLWCATFELVQHFVVYGTSTASSESAFWVGVAFVSYAAVGGAAGAALNALRPRPGVATALLGLAATIALAALNTAVIPTAWVGLVAGLLAYTRWRWPGAPSRRRTLFRGLFFGALSLVGVGWLVAGMSAGVFVDADTPRPTGPNVVVIVMDAVRRDHTSAYGYDRDTTPNLAALAERGTRWDGFSNATWSLPSHATIVTGAYAGTHGAHDEGGPIDPSMRTLQQRFGAVGYDTLLVTGNPWLAESNRIGGDFDTRVDSWGRTLVPAAFQGLSPLRAWWNAEHDKGGAYGVRRFERWLRARPDRERPFFVLVNIIEAHAPYHEVPRPSFTRWLGDDDLAGADALSEALLRHHVSSSGAPAPSELPRVRAMYDGAVHAADAVLGGWIGALDTYGELDETLVVVTADHGEYLGEHGLWGHLHGLYEPVLTVPMVMHGPGVSAGLGAGPARLIDVAPTVLTFAGLPADGTQGRPLQDAAPDDPVIAEQYIPFLPSPAAAGLVGDLGTVNMRRRSVRVGTDKLHVYEDGTVKRYELSVDPGEHAPLGAGPATDALLLQLDGWARSTGIAWPDGAAGSAGAEALDRAALRALGYAE